MIMIDLKGKAEIVREWIEEHEVTHPFHLGVEKIPGHFVENFVLTPEQKKKVIGAILNEAHRKHGRYHNWYWSSDIISCGDYSITDKGYEWEDSIECDAKFSFEDVQVRFKGNVYNIYTKEILPYGSSKDTNNFNIIAVREYQEPEKPKRPLIDNCRRCGRGFYDKGKGNATRIDPAKYAQTTDNCEDFCTACFYEFNCGFSGKELAEA